MNLIIEVLTIMKNSKKFSIRDSSIYNMDSLNFLKQLDNNSVDLILTDPPYFISRDTNFKSGGVKRFAVSMDFGNWDKGYETLDLIIKEYYRVLRKGGTLIIFYDLWKISFLSEIMKREKFKQLRFIEWIKTNPVPLNSKINYLTNSREIALTATKESKPTFNSKYDNGIYKHPIYHSKNRFHPTQKPLKLFEEIILKHSKEGDLVIDTYLGSGTSLLASLNTSRKFKGCELDSSIFNKSIDRVIKEYKNNESCS